jgi:hypothetical protein
MSGLPGPSSGESYYKISQKHHASSGLKVEAVCFSETLVSLYKSIHCYYTEVKLQHVVSQYVISYIETYLILLDPYIFTEHF